MSRYNLRQAGATRLAIGLFVLLAFTSQAIVAQTHVHFVRGTGDATTLSLKSNATHGSLPAKAPTGDDETNCPICQGLLHVGSYVTPSPVAMMILIVASYIIAIAIEVAAIAQPHSHGWNSRAPPLS